MSETSVFECGICYFSYDDRQHRPMSLPCGHVFCQECVAKQAQSGVVCPYDQTKFSAGSNFPCCYAILASLPGSSHQDFYSCSKHAKKKIKFHCKVDNRYFCSDCIIEHTGNNHAIEAFAISKAVVRGQIQELTHIAQRRAKGALNVSQSLESLDSKLKTHYESQFHKINHVYDKAIEYLDSKRSKHIHTLKSLQHKQWKQIEVQRQKLGEQKCKLAATGFLSQQLQRIDEELESHPYEEIASILTRTALELSNLEELGLEEPKLYQFKDYVKIDDNSSFSKLKNVCEEHRDLEDLKGKPQTKLDLSKCQTFSPRSIPCFNESQGSKTARHKKQDFTPRSHGLLEKGDPWQELTTSQKSSSENPRRSVLPPTPEGLNLSF